MPDSPKRSTRSGSNSTTINFNDIKTLIDNRMKELHSLIQNTRVEIIQTFRDELDQLTHTMTTVKDNVLELQKSNELLKKKSEEMEKELNSFREQHMHTLNEITYEVEERERRKLNIVVSGLPESPSDSADERKQHDLTQCEMLLSTLNISNPESIQHIHRIGLVKQQKPRLLKLKCNTIEEKIAILRKSIELRLHSNYKGIYINPDRTSLQRILHKKLREELFQRKNNGEDVMILRDRVVVRRNNRNF